MRYYILNADKTAALCRDNRWREFGIHGTVSSCFKIYKQKGSAERRAERIRGIVAEVPPEWSVDASLNCHREIPTRPGFHKVENKHLSEFLIEPLDTKENQV